MEQKEFIIKLKDKLEAYAKEIKQLNNTEELTEKFSDMLEVIKSISSMSGINFDQIEKKCLEQCDAKEGDPSLKSNHNCLFCQFFHGEKEVKFFDTFLHCYAIKDQFPVSNGHVIIIPNEHTENWFTAKEEVRLDMMRALNILKSRLDLEYHPHGYNIGINCGEVAGQSIMHLHLHLIPRYKGDMENPKGGVRGVIPSKQKY